MKILDTNLWVFGTLRTNEQAAELLAEIDRGETTSAINAYMVQEALAAFDRTQSLSAADRDTVKTRFLTRLTRMTGLIEAPSSRDVSDALLREQRSAPTVQTLAPGGSARGAGWSSASGALSLAPTGRSRRRECGRETKHRFREFEAVPDDEGTGQPMWECQRCGTPRYGAEPEAGQ